jgi:hypothetical protein
MNKIQLKYYTEKARAKGKTLLIEDCNYIITKTNLEVLKEGTLIESDGKKYEALAVVKNCPVSKYTINKNNRIYGKDLWETIQKSGNFEGTYSLADHPVEEGSVKDTWGIWHGLTLTEDGAFSNLYLIEEKPLRILKAGGSLGTSSVGYGEFQEDGQTVDANSYELERLGDIVLNPSQGTFASFENIQETQKNEKKEQSFLSENTNNKIEIDKENSIKDNNSEDLQMNKLEVLNAKNHIKNALKEAKESTNYKDQIDKLEEMFVDVPDELTEQKNKISETISELKTKMSEEIVNKSKSLEEKVKEYTELKTKFDTVNASLTSMTENFKKAEAIINKAGLQEDTDKVCYKTADAQMMESNLAVMKEDISSMTEDRNLMEADMKIMEEDMKAMNEDINIFKKERIKLQKQIKEKQAQLKKAEKHISGLEKILEDEFDYEFEDDDEVLPMTDMDGDEIVVDGQIYEPICEDEVGQDITSGSVAKSGLDYVSVEDGSNKLGNFGDNAKTKADSKAEPDYDEDKAAEDGVDTAPATQVTSTYTEAEETDDVKQAEDEYTLDEAEDDEDKEDDKEDKDDEDKDKVEEAEEDDKEDKEADKKDDEDKEDEKMEEEYIFRPRNSEVLIETKIKNKKQIKKQESVKARKPIRIETTKEVLDFYKKVSVEKPAIKDFKREILSSKSLVEAVEKVASLKRKTNDMGKVTQKKTSNPKEGLVEYTFKTR